MMRPLPLRLSLFLVALLSLVLGALLTNRSTTPQLRILIPALEGDGALVIMPEGQSLLLDGGADGAALATWLGNVLPFGQRRIDAVVLSRAEKQTLPGQLAALRRYQIGTALLPASERRSSSMDAWWELLEDQQVAPQVITAGDQLKLGQCTLDAIAEHEGRLAFGLHCGTTTAYFLQALDDDLEAALEVQQFTPATLVVYPWSRATNTPLMRSLQPAAIVFSDGVDGDNAALSWADRQVGDATLYHESLNGQIELINDGQHTMIRVEREQNTHGD